MLARYFRRHFNLSTPHPQAPHSPRPSLIGDYYWGFRDSTALRILSSISDIKPNGWHLSLSLLCDRFITELKRETSGKPTIKLHLQNLSQIKLSLSCHKAEPFYCLLSLYFWVANSGNWTNHYWGSSSTMADCGLDCGRHDKTAWYGYKNRHPNNAYILHIPTA